MKRNLLAFAAVILVTLFGSSVIAQQPPADPRTKDFIDQRDTLAKQLLDSELNMKELLRQRDEALKKAAECAPKQEPAKK